MNRDVPLSPGLAAVVGARALSRPEAVKRLWAHCRDRGLLNPEDKREILFDPPLEQLLGRPSARMVDLIGLLMPHFDFASQGREETVATATSAKNVKLAKNEAVRVKQPCKSESAVVKNPRLEGAVPVKMACKDEVAAPRAPVAAAGGRGAAVPGAVKFEGDAEPTEGVAGELRRELERVELEECVRSSLPRLSRIGRTTVTVECRPTSGAFRFEAVAEPLPAPGGAESGTALRAPCTVGFHELAAGGLEPFGEVQLTGLDPALAYRVAFEVRSLAAGESATVARSPEVMLSQRAQPARWTAQEALQWCLSLQVPELARKVEEYRIDGTTLLALGEDDLSALGVVAPFLQRRVLESLQELRGISAAGGGPAAPA